MPEFTPNEHMLEMHSDKGQEDWEIYAECVRDLISKQTGLPKSDGLVRDKAAYESLLNGEKRVVEIKGVSYTL